MIYGEEIKEIKDELAQVNKITAELSSAKYQHKLTKKNIVILILSILLLFSIVLNLYFIVAYERVTETTETYKTTTFEGVKQNADNGGTNTVIGGDYNGNTEN